MLIHRAILPSCTLLFVSMLAACGSSGNGGQNAQSATSSTSTGVGGGGFGGAGGSGAGGGGPFMTAPHGAAPQVITYGGTVLTTPKLQIISYASDPYAADVDAFAQELTGVSASAWSAQTAEYGVGPLTVLPTIRLTGAPPATQDDNYSNTGLSPFQQNLANQISGANPAWGPADPSTIYLFILPMGSDISAEGNCCSDFLGYHDECPVGNGSVPYGIVCNCPAVKGDPLTPTDWVTTTVIHEAVEASTDPYVQSNTAYGEADDNHIIWGIATGGEVSDMCDDNADSNFTPAGAMYMIQRSWSNAAAKAGKNPCVPYPTSDPYFNSVPVLTDNISLDFYGQTITTKGARIPVGTSKTIDVQLFSEAGTSGPWTVTAWDYNDYNGFGAKNVDVTFMETGSSMATGQNGDTLHLVVKVNSYDKSLSGAGFVLESDLGDQDNLWFAAIGQ